MAVARVPMQQRLCLGERRQIVGGYESLDGDRTQVRDEESAAVLQCLHVRLSQSDAKAAGALVQAEENGFRGTAKRPHLDRREQRIQRVAALPEHHQLATDNVAAGVRMGREAQQEISVFAPFRRTIQPASAVAQAGKRAEPLWLCGSDRGWH
jgi:hypothetical protein